MEYANHPSWIEINLVQFAKNLSVVRKELGPVRLCLPIKANAYGHGLETIGKAAQMAGIDYLAVAHLQEGIILRRADISIPILVLGAIHEDQVDDLIHFQLDISISSCFKAEKVRNVCKQLGKRCRVHLEVDTGMQRTGVRPETAASLMEYLNAEDCFDVIGVYSHLATSEKENNALVYEQIRAFNELIEQPLFQRRPLIFHMANSGGTVLYPESWYDMVRPSALAFGFFKGNVCAHFEGVAPCFSVKSRISYFKVVKEGMGIGYGHTYTTTKTTRIVTVPIGYGDGYPSRLSNRGEVLIRGKRYPIVGMICMDQFMVDVGQDDAYVGDEVVLLGCQGDEEITIHELAEKIDANPREVLCLFNNRLPRKVYANYEYSGETASTRKGA